MVHKISCSEIWGGIHGDQLDCQTSGVRASLFSRACDGGKGGDIYYFSVCGGDLLTRIAIADVVGHGEQVSQTSQWLYNSLKDHMDDGDGSQILNELNRRAVEFGFDAMTTAAVAAFYSVDQKLYFSYAGHHSILVNRKNQSDWLPASASPTQGLAGLPLGVDQNTAYQQDDIALGAGDRIFLYTDGIIEAMDNSDCQFGENRLRDVLKDCMNEDLPEIRSNVLNAVLDHTGDDLSHDDVTFLAMEVGA